MERALKLAPKNPRVLLLQALENGDSGKLDSRPIEQLKKAAAAFEAERQDVERTPGWGAAEAYVVSRPRLSRSGRCDGRRAKLSSAR